MFMLAIVELEVQYLRGNPDQAVVEALNRDWGSPPQVLLSMYKSVTGGSQWSKLSRSLQEADTVSYVIFVAFTVLFHFVFVNIIISTFVYRTMTWKEQNKERDFRLKRVDEFVGRLQEVFGGHSGTVNFEDFCAVIDSGNHIVADIFAKMGVTVAEVQQLLFSLSRQA